MKSDKVCVGGGRDTGPSNRPVSHVKPNISIHCFKAEVGSLFVVSLGKKYIITR